MGARPNTITSLDEPAVAASYSGFQRANAARRAIARRRRGLSFSALARPPFSPPSLPSAIACGFFRRVMTQGGAKELPCGFLNKIESFGDSARGSSGAHILDRVRNARRAPLIPLFRYVAANGCVGRTDTAINGYPRKRRTRSVARRDNTSAQRCGREQRRMQSC